jgi:predicted dehydrogenase
MCEKPMANTPEDCQAMIDACREANRKLMIAHRAQYEPYNLAAIDMARGKNEATLSNSKFSIFAIVWRIER